MVDIRLTFEPHVENLCRKVGLKLRALGRTADYMDISNKKQHYEFIYPCTILVLPIDKDVPQ